MLYASRMEKSFQVLSTGRPTRTGEAKLHAMLSCFIFLSFTVVVVLFFVGRGGAMACASFRLDHKDLDRGRLASASFSCQLVLGLVESPGLLVWMAIIYWTLQQKKEGD